MTLALALIFGASLLSLRQSSLQTSALREHLGSTMSVVATVRTDPSPTIKKAMGRTFAPRRYSFLAATEYGPIRIIAPKSSVETLLPGQRFEITGMLIRSSEERIAALMSATKALRILSPPSRFQRALASIRLGLRQVSGGGDPGALIPGMVIGDTAQQSADFKNDMKRSGLTHLVAVSGANFAIVSAFILWCMQFIFRTIPPRLIATAIFLAIFIALVRPSPSVLRAAAMAAVALVAMGSRRRGDSLPALAVAIAAVIAIDPWQARDPGFALSVLATAGLLLVAPALIEKMQGRIPQKIASIVAPPIAATALCLPIIVCLSGYISPISIVANIVAAPFVAPITVLGFIAALISPFLLDMAHLIIILIRPFAAAITGVARWGADFPVLTIGKGLFGAAIALIATLLIFVFRVKALIFLLLISAIFIWVGRFPTNDWQIYACDVGQGDATILRLAEKQAIVIDVGPDPSLIDRCLRRLHIKEIPLLILTHAHADHIGGLSGARNGRKVGQTWFGNIAAGSRAKIGQYTIEVLWPENVQAHDENPNNLSIAALIYSQDFTLFASGDIEPPVQMRLRGKVGKVDIYKVAHHGSRYQDEAFMRELSPALALISVGEANTYGHPSPLTISALERIHAKVLRTDRDGSIAVQVHQHQISFQREKSRLRLLQLN